MIRLISFSISLLVALTALAFDAKEVIVYNNIDGVRLAATLVKPSTCVPKAAIVLATGSGAQDRDETILGHKPFKILAEALADKGYAVLRMDDRGVGQSGGDTSAITMDSNLRDIEAGVHWMDSVYFDLPTGIIGHSEGGQIAVRAAKNDNTDFIVTLACPAWPGDSIIMSQGRAMAVAMTGRWDGEPLQRKILEIAKSDIPAYLAKSMIYIEMAAMLGEMAKTPRVQAQLNQQADAVMSPWYREFLRYDPAMDIQSVRIPWLAVNGSKDMQVLPENLASIHELNGHADTLLLKDLNHLFQHASSGSPSEYQSIAEDFSPEAIEAIARWLNETVMTKRD